MDTQGIFDFKTTKKTSANMLALSLMTSSIQIYNILHNLQENDLEYFEYFTDYGRIALNECGSKPFESLIFLIRDWSYAYEYDFGFNGGESLFKKCLKKRKIDFSNLFEDTSCFLMPHPGLKVGTNKKFIGKIEDIDCEFLCQVKDFVESIFTGNLFVKNFNGREITGGELLMYFQNYCKIFESDKMPEANTILKSTSEANNWAAKSKVVDSYLISMKKYVEETNGKTLDLEKKHAELKNQAIKDFKSLPKMGGVSMSEPYLLQIESELDKHFIDLKKLHEKGNLLSYLKHVGEGIGMTLGPSFAVTLGFLAMNAINNYTGAV